MMTTLKNKIETTSIAMNDINATFAFISKYAWFSAGALFVCYLYFVGAITFSVIKQQGLANNIKTIVSETSKEELKYLNIQKGLTEIYAQEKGFVSPSLVSYTIPASTFAWNNNDR